MRAALLLLSVSMAQIQIEVPFGPHGYTLLPAHTLEVVWTVGCPGLCSLTTGSQGIGTVDLVCSPYPYLDFSLDLATWENATADWSWARLVDRRIPSQILSSTLASTTKLRHKAEVVFGLEQDVVAGSACELRVNVEGPMNASDRTWFFTGFNVLAPVATDSWSSGHIHTVEWEPALGRDWVEITLFKGNEGEQGEVINITPEPAAPPSPSLSGHPWCPNSGKCVVFIPDVTSELSWGSLSASDYAFRVRQFAFPPGAPTTDLGAQQQFLFENGLDAWSPQFQVAFNLFAFYKDTSILVYGTVFVVLTIIGMVGIGFLRQKKRKAVIQRFLALQARQNSENQAKVQEELLIKLAVRVIISYYLWVAEEVIEFEKRRKQFWIRFLVVFVPLAKTTLDLVYDVWQYMQVHPHSIFLFDIGFQLLAHVCRLRYESVRVADMKNAGKKADELEKAPAKLIELFLDILNGGKKLTKLRNISLQVWLQLISVTCEQINGIIGVYIAAHLSVNWTDWNPGNAVLLVKFAAQILSFNWSFIQLVKRIMRPMKEKMGLLQTVHAIKVFGGLFLLQRNILLIVIYAGIWHNPTLPKFGSNNTLNAVVAYMILSPLAELMFFISSLVGFVFKDIQVLCMQCNGSTSDWLEQIQVLRDTNQARINNKILFFSVSLITQAIFLVILNATNTFDYTIQSHYISHTVTVYTLIVNIPKCMYLGYSALLCRCCGWGVYWEKNAHNFGKEVHHGQHACCTFWTAGLWIPCWIAACCHFCCLKPCPFGDGDH